MRGKIIAYSSKKKKEQIQKVRELEYRLKEVEKKMLENYTDILLKQVCDVKFQINEIKLSMPYSDLKLTSMKVGKNQVNYWRDSYIKRRRVITYQKLKMI